MTAALLLVPDAARAAVPSTPLAVTATASADRHVTVTWVAPVDDGGARIIGYRVRDSWTQTTRNVAGTAWTGSFAGIRASRPLTFTVAAVNASGVGPKASSIPIRVPARAPSAPVALSATRGNHSVSLSWRAPKRTGGAPVLVYQATEAGGDTWTPVRGTSLTVRGLTNGTAYSFLVRAVNIAGTSRVAQSNRVVPAGAPRRVAKPRAAVRGDKVRLRWAAAAPNGARIRAYRILDGKQVAKVVRAKRRMVVLRHLDPGRHRLRVTARNAVGWSAPSRAVVVRVRPG